MSLFLAEDSAKQIFCEICVNSKSLSARPRKAVVSCELSTDLNWLVRVLRMRFLEYIKFHLSTLTELKKVVLLTFLFLIDVQ